MRSTWYMDKVPSKGLELMKVGCIIGFLFIYLWLSSIAASSD